MAKENDRRGTNPEFLARQGSWGADPAAASAAGKVGSQRSAAVKRKRRMMRDAARDILSMSAGKLPSAEKLAGVLQAAGIDAATVADALVLAQALKAAQGDTEAARYIRDTAGERPADLLQVSAADRPIDADSVTELSDEELAQLAEDLKPEALPAPDPAGNVAAGVALPEADGAKII